ncbi:engulfment and cell motility protein 1-like [Actinia tenebrosa]|uniref:Engulfment and cell motility protein 1-like n=1 Tax=Actinia tenebrosa TaxID=6105 RepID=A0A6P8I177_ACTTE|nr:engulfment and cell motility protein 1-like [Actinia tenebrosa]
MEGGIVRIAIEKEGQLPQLILFDQSQPLESIIKDACAKWNMSIPEQYALQYADFNNYITEENRFEIKNGTVLKLMLSPAKLAQEIYDKLQSPAIEDKRNTLSQLSSISEDLTFAGEFIKRKGLGLIISILEKRPDPEAMASALKAFQELMEHPGVSWDTLTHGFIKNLTVFVNKKSLTDPTVLNRCLSILESIVSNSSTLYPLVEKEVIFDNLIQHLHSGNQEIQLNAIALINGLFLKTDQTHKRQFADRMIKTGVRGALLNYVIRANKPIKGEMAHQLYVYQALMFGLQNDMLLTKGGRNNQSLLESLDILRKTAFESDIVSSCGRPLSQAGHPGKDFKRLGFTEYNNPVQDFSEVPPGLLPIHAMLFFARKHQDQYIKVVLENLSRGDDYECPFARSSIALTKMLCEVLKINGEPPADSSEEYYPIFFTTDHGFEEFFCICIQLVNKTWKEMRATANDFNRVMAVVREQIVRSLGERQPTMEAFKNYVFNLGFTQILKLMQQEFHERNIMELKARPVVELKEQILPELKKIVRRQRLDQLIEGRVFDRQAKRNKFWYCRLSPNLKFLHYGDCEEGQTPSLEALPNKLPISGIKQLVVGKDCPHAREKKVKAYLLFSLTFEREAGDESLNFIATNQKVFDIWVDGLSALLNKEMPSKESKEDLETLLNMEIKLRLLDLENIQIPESPPPIPSDPPNYNFVYKF